MLAHAALFLFGLAKDGNVRSLRTLGALLDCELDLLAFLQVTETVTLNGGEMDENVRSTFALDEAEALVTVEPFYCTDNAI